MIPGSGGAFYLCSGAARTVVAFGAGLADGWCAGCGGCNLDFSRRANLGFAAAVPVDAGGLLAIGTCVTHSVCGRGWLIQYIGTGSAILPQRAAFGIRFVTEGATGTNCAGAIQGGAAVICN